MTKFQIAIITLFLGFALGQSVDFLKYNWSVWRKKAAINSEIDDLLKQLCRRIDRTKVILNDTLNPEMVGTPIPNEFKTIIYDKHYAEIAHLYSPERREALSNIYGTLEGFNSQLKQIAISDSASIRKSLVNLFYYCKLTKHCIDEFKENKRPVPIENDTELMLEIQKEVQSLYEKYV